MTPASPPNGHNPARCHLQSNPQIERCTSRRILYQAFCAVKQREPSSEIEGRVICMRVCICMQWGGEGGESLEERSQAHMGKRSLNHGARNCLVWEFNLVETLHKSSLLPPPARRGWDMAD